MTGPELDRLADATDLAQLLGDTPVPVDLLGVVASHATDDGPLTVDTVVKRTRLIDRELVGVFFEYLLSRGYAVEAGGPTSIDVKMDDCVDLLVRTRTAARVLERARPDSDPVTLEFICTLPEDDPSFRDHDPIDFDMHQVTTRLLSLCRNAKEELVLTSPFLEVEGLDWLLPGLEGALERGVDLTLVSRELQAEQPNHTAVKELLRIAEGLPGDLEVYDYYEPSSDGQHPEYTLHSKLLVADRRVAYVGSANFTKYGFSENLEVGVVVDAPAVESLYSIVAHLVAHGAVRVER